MGRAPCCDKDNVKRGPWSPEEDSKLKAYIQEYGTGGNWIALPNKIGLKRCGKSCRLRWLNYLRPNIKHGGFSEEEDTIICTLYMSIGSRWSIIAGQLPGRTDNDIKNYWNTKLKKKLLGKHRKDQRARSSSSSSSSSTSRHLISGGKRKQHLSVTISAADHQAINLYNVSSHQQMASFPAVAAVPPNLHQEVQYFQEDHDPSSLTNLLYMEGKYKYSSADDHQDQDHDDPPIGKISYSDIPYTTTTTTLYPPHDPSDHQILLHEQPCKSHDELISTTAAASLINYSTSYSSMYGYGEISDLSISNYFPQVEAAADEEMKYYMTTVDNLGLVNRSTIATTSPEENSTSWGDMMYSPMGIMGMGYNNYQLYPENTGHFITRMQQQPVLLQQ